MAAKAYVFFVAVVLFAAVNGDRIKLEEETIKKLLANYNPMTRPPFTDSGENPVVVQVNTFVRNIQDISDVRMEFTPQLTFRMMWKDKRLEYSDHGGVIKYLTIRDTERLWKPDLFFANERDGHFHTMLFPNELMRIFSDGTVLFSIRLSMTLACPMDLKNYPMDTQTCSITMASYGYTTDDIIFKWKESDPIQVTKNLHLPRFTLNKFITDYCTSRTNTGEYSCLRADFTFQREKSYYVKQYFIPFAMMALVSWVSFWISKRSPTPKVLLNVITLLCGATFASSINSSMPAVSYTMAIDVWTGVNLTFYFTALLVTATSLFYFNRQCADGAIEKSYNGSIWQKIKRTTTGGKVDLVARIVYPLAYVIFNIIYWAQHKQEDIE